MLDLPLQAQLCTDDQCNNTALHATLKKGDKRLKGALQKVLPYKKNPAQSISLIVTSVRAGFQQVLHTIDPSLIDMQAGAPASSTHGPHTTHQHAQCGGPCVHPRHDDWPDFSWW
jgi:hypothetical protein